MSRYFFGAGSSMGRVLALKAKTFEELCEALSKPQVLPITREAYHALPSAKEQSEAKRVNYITPAEFTESPSKRHTHLVKCCNLVCLDIDGKDDPTEGRRLLDRGFAGLGALGFIAWHTATSTDSRVRVRVVVNADNIPTPLYSHAVWAVAEMLGLSAINSESSVAVQPMFWPTVFAGETASPIIAQAVEGTALTAADIGGVAGGAPGHPHQQSAPLPAGDVDIDFLRLPMEGITLAEVDTALEHIDADCSMGQWIEVAAGLKHQFGEAGYDLWDKWSARGKKYVDSDETEYRWGTLKAQPTDRAPVTIRSVFRLATERGWSNQALTKKIYEETLAWVKSPQRSTEELMDQAIKKIAKAAPALGMIEKKTLMATLQDVMVARDMPLTLSDIKKEVRKLEVDAMRATGLPPWARGLCYVSALNIFYRYATDRRFPPEVMDLMYSTPKVSDDDKPMRPRDFLIQVAGVQLVENLRYDPAQGTKRFFTEDAKPYVNTYRPTYAPAEPDRAEEAGDIFRAHIENLIAEPDYQRTLIDYLAYHVQHPGKKIRWAVLLQGAKGCGKTAIAVAMAAVLGRRNICKLSASNVLDGQHNDWAYGSQLVVMEEVRVVGHNRFGVMDKLKPCISDDDISLRRMYEAPQTVPNITNYLMFTNHHDSLAIQDDDRRYFVLSSPMQRTDDIKKIGGEAYFNRLFGMFKDNAGGLRAWLEEWPISKTFQPNGRAPVTRYLLELAEAAASPLAAAVMLATSEEPHPLVRKNLLSMAALRGILDSSHLSVFSDQALSSVLRELGWTKYDRMFVEGARHQIWFKDMATSLVKHRTFEYAKYL